MEQQPQTRRQRDKSQEQMAVNKQTDDTLVSQNTTSGEEEVDRGRNALSRRRTPQNDGQMMQTGQEGQLHHPQPGAKGQAVTQANNGRGGAPAVRLDMDLNIDIKMKAKIKGDVTLSILEGDQK